MGRLLHGRVFEDVSILVSFESFLFDLFCERSVTSFYEMTFFYDEHLIRVDVSDEFG